MARLTYADPAASENSELARQIISERGGELPNLYRMLLNSPPIAEGWLNLLTAVRQRCTLAGRIRELAILRVALLNRADYEYRGHIPYAKKAGVSEEQIEALANWQSSPCFDEQEQCALALIDSMTRQIQVPEEIFERAFRHFGNRQTLELCVTVGAYNMISRFLEAVKIDHD
jgi:AhpD family alkylhydroperoxidase